MCSGWGERIIVWRGSRVDGAFNGLMMESRRAGRRTDAEDEDEDDELVSEEHAWQMRRLQLIMKELQQDCDRLRASLCMSEFQRGMLELEHEQRTSQVKGRFSEIYKGLNELHARECDSMHDELRTKAHEVRSQHDACKASVSQTEQANKRLMEDIDSAEHTVVSVENESEQVKERIRLCTLKLKRMDLRRITLEARAHESQLKSTSLQNKCKEVEEEIDGLRSAIRHNQGYARHVSSIRSSRRL